jgi:hypothetical protein
MQTDWRWRIVTEDPLERKEVLATLLEQAARARRLAATIRGDPAASQLEQLAEELDARIAEIARAKHLRR